jgi:hypothetical protein
VHQPHAAAARQYSGPSGLYSWMTKSFTRRASRCTDSTSPVSSPSPGANRVSASSGGPSSRRSWSSSCVRIEQHARRLILGNPWQFCCKHCRTQCRAFGWWLSGQRPLCMYAMCWQHSWRGADAPRLSAESLDVVGTEHLTESTRSSSGMHATAHRPACSSARFRGRGGFRVLDAI